MSSIEESSPRGAETDDRTRPADHDRLGHDAGALGGTDGPGPREQRLTEPDRRALDDRREEADHGGRRGDGDPGRDPVAGHSEPGRGAAASGRRDGDEPATLISRDRSADFRARWESVKAGFVDEPRKAVRGADELVGQVLDEIEDLFRRQRAELERDLHDDQASTEDLRLALGRYRSFFDRLLAF